MTYGDEGIIARRVKLKDRKAHTIKKIITIDEVKYTFSEREFDYGFSMVVPESFEDMPEEIINRKFPSSNRPGIIISSGDTRICFAFRQGDLPLNTSLTERLDNCKAFLKRLYPNNVFFSEQIYETPKKLDIACYDFRSVAIDADIYNLSFFIYLSDWELFGWFVCPVELQEKWEPLVREMVQTIKFVKEG